ncbi:MAG: AI-2E family transporter [Acidobacteriaceae bacterium]|nr:AI-2E family transporter [Acidobacteriaceae bacterium]
MTVVCGLYFGKEVLIPFALAVLLSFLLTPPVTWLERLRIGRAPSVLFVLLVAFSAAGAISWVGTAQLSEIISRLPQYQENMRRKIEAVGNPAAFGFSRAAESLRQITSQLSPTNAAVQNHKKLSTGSDQSARNPIKEPQAAVPVPVEVVKAQPSALESLGLIGTSIAHFLAAVAAIAVLTLFMLLKRADLRNRLFRLFGKGRINVMTTAMDDAATRVSSYLLTQSAINTVFGLLLGVGLYCIGLPYAAFWGVLAAFMRFVPYVGTLIAGSCPFLLSLAVFEGWTKPLLTLGVFVAIEGVTSGMVEPWLYATRTGISSLAILVSAAFWTVLWGPIGLVLSTPLTVLLVVLGRYVPQLEFLYILLGDEPVLPPEACYYQRLLAMDEDDAREVAEEYLKEKTAAELYDAVLIPALSLAEQDRHENSLDPPRQKFIYENTKELIEDIGERQMSDAGSNEHARQTGSHLSALCIPARDEADELVGLMLAQLLKHAGHPTKAIPIASVEKMLAVVAERRPDVLVISALPPFAVSHARTLCRRVRQRSPDVKIVVGLWGSHEEVKTIQERLGNGCADHVVYTLSQAEVQVRLLGGLMPTANREPSPALLG